MRSSMRSSIATALALSLAACHGSSPGGGNKPDAAVREADAMIDASTVTRFDAPPGTPDASPADASPADASLHDASPFDAGWDGAAQCDLVGGTWMGTLSNGITDVAWTFDASGTSSGAFTTGGNVVTDNGPWSLSPTDVLSFSTSSCTPSTACPCSGQGDYQLDFSSDCNTATATLVDDACPGRSGIVDGLVLTRN
jgi:hypothetical protein